MTAVDEHAPTLVLPRVRVPADDAVPPVDRWDRASPPTEPDGALAGRRQALSTLAWLLPTLVSAVLSLVRITWPGLGPRELATWGIATTPWDQAQRLVSAVDVAELPYLALLRAWTAVAGTSDFALRAPSVIAVVGATAVVAVIGNRLAGPRVGIVAGLLFATVPTTVRFAHEAGPPAIALFATVLSGFALLCFLDRPGWWRGTGYSLAVVLLGLAHVTALVVVLAHGLVVWVMRRRLTGYWSLAAVVGAAPAIGLLVYRYPSWVGGSGGGMPGVEQLTSQTFGSVLIGGVTIGLALLSVSAAREAVVFAVWALVPILLLLPLTEATSFQPTELLLLAVPGWVGLGALTLGRARMIRGLVAFVAVAALALPAHAQLRHTDGHGLASREAGAVLTAMVLPGDAIVFGPGLADQRVGRDLVARYVPADRRPRDVLLYAPPRTGGRIDAVECTDVTGCLARAPRVWLLRLDRPPGASVDDLSATLDGFPAVKDGPLRVHYRIAQVWPLTGLTLTLLTLMPTEPGVAGQ